MGGRVDMEAGRIYPFAVGTGFALILGNYVALALSKMGLYGDVASAVVVAVASLAGLCAYALLLKPVGVTWRK